jgi:hypothetical protein
MAPLWGEHRPRVASALAVGCPGWAAELAWIHPDQAKARKAIAVPLNEMAAMNVVMLQVDRHPGERFEPPMVKPLERGSEGFASSAPRRSCAEQRNPLSKLRRDVALRSRLARFGSSSGSLRDGIAPKCASDGALSRAEVVRQKKANTLAYQPPDMPVWLLR